MKYFYRYTLIVLFVGCIGKADQQFELITPQVSGIHFQNTPNPSLNILDYLYYYNGGGVAAGDIDNDGLIDLYFTANQRGANKLYRNKGGFQFEDITVSAGVAGTADWHSGVTMVDINGDGLLDIYVSVVSGKFGLNGTNQLFVNEGNGRFTEKAAEYGLNFQGYATQAAFFDYDHDGDLDCYLLTQSDHSVDRFADTSLRRKETDKTGDRLYRNDGGSFTDVSKAAGIYSSVLGYGLGLAIADLNDDGWEDIYVGNDFHENDYYYINNGNGTFTEAGADHFNHYSRFSMGNDIADFNNDAAPDLFTADMLPEEEKHLKTYSSGETLDIYRFTIERNGYQPQYSRNALQVNLGKGKAFSDLALQYGVAATDWSWCPLFADFDNDGWKDLFVSNGIRHRPVDLDYMKFISDHLVQKQLGQTNQLDSAALSQMPDGAMHNYLFANQQGEGFSNISLKAGLGEANYSSGAVYADLDNDGRLDLIVNNSYAPAGIYCNRTTENNWIQLSLEDLHSMNRNAIGAKIYVWQNGNRQYQQLMLTRGFQSSVSPRLHVGLGAGEVVDSIQIIWPDQSTEILKAVAVNQHLIISKQNNLPQFVKQTASPTLLTDITDQFQIPWKHKENEFTDFLRQRLIPHELSKLGPGLAIADINGDGYDDMYAGGTAAGSGAFLLSKPDGEFETFIDLIQPLSMADETVCLLEDFNGDGRPDLFIGTGGNERFSGDSVLRDRLFIQTENGRFKEHSGLPFIAENTGAAAAADVDGDGDPDLFIGVRANTRGYGIPMNSYLLLNDGKGNFSPASEKMIDLKNLGMVSAAAWADFDKDGRPDLVVAGEWMPIHIFLNKGSHFEKKILANTSGMWQSIELTDIDKDGDIDVLAGNFGTNSKLKASTEFPLRLYVKDLDQNGQSDPLLTYSTPEGEYSFLGKDELEQQVPSIKRQFLRYSEFAGKSVTTILPNWINGAEKHLIQTLQSSLLLNDGVGNFSIQALPAAAQVAPIFSFLATDLNRDGHSDILTAGNFSGSSPYEGRYDANWGTVLSGNGKNVFDPIWPAESGFINRGETRNLRKLNRLQGVLYVAAINNGHLRFFSANKPVK